MDRHSKRPPVHVRFLRPLDPAASLRTRTADTQCTVCVAVQVYLQPVRHRASGSATRIHHQHQGRLPDVLRVVGDERVAHQRACTGARTDGKGNRRRRRVHHPVRPLLFCVEE